MATDGQMSLNSFTNLDVLRQRAQKAAEHYRQQQLCVSESEKVDDGKSTSSRTSSTDYQISPQYSDHYKSNNSLEAQFNYDSRRGSGAGTVGSCNKIYKILAGASANTALAPSSGSSFSRAKMQAGIIDLRSSYNGRLTGTAARIKPGIFNGPHASSRARTQTYAADSKPKPGHQQAKTIAWQQYFQKQDIQPSPLADTKTYTTNKSVLSRSSSTMDNGELDSPPPAAVSLHRDYGSTSSLDILGTSSENFFSLISEFEQHNTSDQRSPAPPQLRELLQGRLGSSSKPQTTTESSRNVQFMDALTPSDKDSGSSDDPSKHNTDKIKHKERTQRAKSITFEAGVSLLKNKSKHKEGKQRAKSIADENSVGILRKLRAKIDSDLINVKLDYPGIVGEDSSSRSEGDSWRRAFVHFDCQSVGVDLGRVIHQRVHRRMSKSNATSGASAASGQQTNNIPNKDNPDVLADADEGDGRSNQLVLSCPYFRNEIGGETERTVSLTKVTSLNQVAVSPCTSPVISADNKPQVRHPACCGVSILDSTSPPSDQVLPPSASNYGHVFEYVDHGAYYYRHFFYTQDHQNMFGLDESLGPIAISVRREKLDLEQKTKTLPYANCGIAQYRIICRTSELRTLRGCILTEVIPSRTASTRGIPIKDLLEKMVPEVQLSCLRQAVVGQKTCEQLLKLDEQGISNTYKVGVMYCQSGQATEEEMYNNETSGPALEEFLGLISQKVRLKGFEGFRAGLDCKTDTTGSHSYYTTYNNNEIMFHVSTMLPCTPNNKQQLLRKRHIGNDIVTIVFQEPGALAFTPQTVRSQFQHVFIIVRVSNPNSENTRYSIAVTRSKDVPHFGPKIAENCSFKKSHDFVDFLLTKVINAENAAHKSDKFLTMATRTREEYLKDLSNNYTTNTPIESGSKLSKFGLGSGRKKEKLKQKVILDIDAKGALVWDVQVEDMGTASQVECLLAIAVDTIVLVEQSSKDVIFTVPCSAVIGWTPQPSSLRLYFGAGECILFRPLSGASEEMQDIIRRLQTVTLGTETFKLALKRSGMGPLGFHIQSEGVVTDVEAYGFAWEAGLRKGSRLVEICKVATITLSHDQILDLLRTSAIVKVVVVSPMEDGSPRGNNSLNTTPASTPTTEKATLLSKHQLQQRLFPSSKSSPRCPPAVGSSDIPDSTVISGQSFIDGRNSYFGYSRQELADMYKTSHSSQEGLISSGDETYSKNKTYESGILVTPGISSRSQPNQHNQFLLHRGESIIGFPDVSVDRSAFGSASKTSSARRHFASMEHLSGVTPAGNISLERLKQIQNKRYLSGQSQGSLSQDSLKQSPEEDSSLGSETNLSQTSGGSVSRTSQHTVWNHFKRSSKGESTQTNTQQGDQTSKPTVTDSYMEPQPQSSRRNLSSVSSEESLPSQFRFGSVRQKPVGQTRQDFHGDLLRLFDPSLSENGVVGNNIEITEVNEPELTKDILYFQVMVLYQTVSPQFHRSRGQTSHKSGQLPVTQSEDSLYSSKGLVSDKTQVQINGFSSQRLPQRAIYDLTSANQNSKSTVNNHARVCSQLYSAPD